ncbi:MAG: tripartite tricarboxylate transporter substrate binding protein [Burkholderiales bacterium]|nr:tripartite tricarboxylate transporter substrate binding protein [Burkholderiales bacterium]
MNRLLTWVAATALLLLAAPGHAQSWPAKPVRMILAFPPGGPTDIVARVLAQKLTEQLGQQFVVDNKPGAGGNIGAELAAKAPSDGHTIFYNTSAIVINPALYGRASYDTLKDFVPVALTAAIPMVLVVHPSVPAKTMKEFVDHVRARAGQVNYSSSGTGTITHLASAMLAAQMGFTAQHVPYKGSAPGLVDLAAGQTQFMTDTINTALPYVKDGRLRAIAVTSLKRSSVLPEAPTFAESGLPGFEAAAWQGVVGAARTAPEIVARLNAEINRALADAGVRARLAGQGADVLGGTAAEYAAYIRAEMPRWARAIKDSGAKAE